MADEEPLRRCIIEASRRHALEGRSQSPTISLSSPMVLAAAAFAAGLCFGTRRSLARTALILGSCGGLAAILIGNRELKPLRGEQTANDELSIERSKVDEASSFSFPSSDPPAF